MTAAPDLFAGSGPRVYAMAAHRPFLDDLAATISATLADPDNPWGLADAIVLVPNRRAARELTAAFVRAAGAAPAASLLPAIRALGDVEEDEPPFEPGELALAAPPAISPARRRFELASLLHRRALARNADADPAASIPLAEELGRLLDEAAAAGGVDFPKVKDLYERLPIHLQESATFIEIILKFWPQRLAELERIDAAERRAILMHALADRWKTVPPDRPVIAAGSTGSLIATQAVLRAVANLPKGLVILPGLDIDLDDRAWDEVDTDEGHPQANLKRTLTALGVTRADVREWPAPPARHDQPPEFERRASARGRLINEALRPAEATSDWLERIAALNTEHGVDVVREGLRGLSLIEAPTPDAEARAVALAVREALEESSRDVMIVTPDLSLADRIAVVLERFGIFADVSAGRPFIETEPGSFLAHVLTLARDPGDPVALVALVKHRFTALGDAHRNTRITFAEVERKALRGVRAGDDLAAVLARLTDPNRRDRDPGGPEACALVQAMADALAPFDTLRFGVHPVAEFAQAHAEIAETIAATAEATGADRLWRDEAGETAAALIRELMEESEALQPVRLDSYARLFERLARARAVRVRGREQPRVRLLGPLEARLQSAGLIVVSGLNEGTWPAHTTEDPFLSRGMRQEVGLPPPERRLSLAAHDFAQLACAPNVLLTRSVRNDSGPTVASRWLWRLQTLVRGASPDGALTQELASDTDYIAIARALDRVTPKDASPASQPCAYPPVSARPRKLSASRVREWIRDPYGLYARSILRLRMLDPLDASPGPRERGNALHDALDRVVGECRDALPDDFERRIFRAAMEELGKQGFGDSELVAEAERMRRAAAWFTAWETDRRAAGWSPALLEEEGQASVDAPEGPFTVFARADRLDRGPEGVSILDYKTGQPPSEKAARIGLEPQLGIEAVILALGGFSGLPKAAPSELVYLRVRGGRSPGAVASLFSKAKDYSVADFTAETLTRLKKKAAEFDNPDTGYTSRARVQKTNDTLDYDRLARVKEWATPGEDEA